MFYILSQGDYHICCYPWHFMGVVANGGGYKVADFIILFIAASRPTIKQLNRFVIPRVAPNWYNLGLELLSGDEARTLNSYNGSIQKRCSQVFRVWLERNPKADWYQLVEALKNVQLNDVAGDLRNMFTGLSLCIGSGKGGPTRVVALFDFKGDP